MVPVVKFVFCTCILYRGFYSKFEALWDILQGPQFWAEGIFYLTVRSRCLELSELSTYRIWVYNRSDAQNDDSELLNRGGGFLFSTQKISADACNQPRARTHVTI